MQGDPLEDSTLMNRFVRRPWRPSGRRSDLGRAVQLGVAALLAFGLMVVAAWAAPPVPSFTFSPSDPVEGEVVTFTSTSTDPDNDIDSITWDLDTGSSFNDGSGNTATEVYNCDDEEDPPPCTMTARIRVEDDDENVRTASRTFTVRANQGPTASFTVNPESPETSQQFTLTSTSTDPEGRALTAQWDTNGNGSFTDTVDRTGNSTTLSFSTNGPRTIGLRVTDSGGLRSTATRTIEIRNRPPVASFNVSADSVDTGQPIQFTSTSTDPDGQVQSFLWDFNSDGLTDATGSSVTQSFPEDGTLNVRLRVVDDDGGSSLSAARPITIRNRLPIAAFNVSAQEVEPGDPVELTSTSSDPDGQVQLAQWDLDGDGQYDDATGNKVTHSFTNGGQMTVGLRVIDDDNGSATTSRQVTVRQRRPTASFTYTPNAPFAGDEIVLTSTSTDPDGEIEEYEWDFDEDAVVLDAEGPEARIRFDQPGSYQVGLQVTDDDGRESTEVFDTIDVTQRPDPPPSGTGGGSGGQAGSGTGNAVRRALIPFPSVRIRGMTTATGARIDLLSVRTPGSVRILVRCRGGGCPYARRIRRVRFAETQVRTVKLPGFRRRYLRAGTVLRIFVIDDGVIGKYTRFDIRRGLRPPRRIDRCAVPGRFRVRSCPA
jgi:PKD domain